MPRYLLLWVALTELVLAVPTLLGASRNTSVHTAHELGSWEAALAVGLLVAAWQPRRAAGLLPFALALAGAMVATAAFDIVTATRLRQARRSTSSTWWASARFGC